MTLIELVADVLQESPANVTDATSRKTHRRWDSFNHVQLMVRVEDEYGVKLSNAEIEGLSSVSEVRALLKQKGVASL